VKPALLDLITEDPRVVEPVEAMLTGAVVTMARRRSQNRLCGGVVQVFHLTVTRKIRRKRAWRGRGFIEIATPPRRSGLLVTLGEPPPNHISLRLINSVRESREEHRASVLDNTARNRHLNPQLRFRPTETPRPDSLELIRCDSSIYVKVNLKANGTVEPC